MDTDAMREDLRLTRILGILQIFHVGRKSHAGCGGVHAEGKRIRDASCESMGKRTFGFHEGKRLSSQDSIMCISASFYPHGICYPWEL